MKFEKLTDNKIRIFLNLEDLQKQNMDFHTFMSNSIESQKLFSDVLAIAEKECGFITRDYKILLEALVTPECNFILTVTRFPRDVNKNYTKSKKLSFKRKLSSDTSTTLIYTFSSFDDFCDFCIGINDINVHRIAKRICLYYFKNIYYLVFNNVYRDSLDLKKVRFFITEFGEIIYTSDLFERKLIEYGRLVIKNNAISICNKFFVR